MVCVHRIDEDLCGPEPEQAMRVRIGLIIRDRTHDATTTAEATHDASTLHTHTLAPFTLMSGSLVGYVSRVCVGVRLLHALVAKIARARAQVNMYTYVRAHTRHLRLCVAIHQVGARNRFNEHVAGARVVIVARI